MFSRSLTKFTRPFNKNNSDNYLGMLINEFPEVDIILDDFDLGGFLELNRDLGKTRNSLVKEIPGLDNLLFYIYQDMIINLRSIENLRAEKNLYIDCFLDSYFKKINKIRVLDFKDKLDKTLYGFFKQNYINRENWFDKYDAKYVLNTINYENSFIKINFNNMFFNLVNKYVDIRKARVKSGIKSVVCVVSPKTKRNIESAFINSEIYEFMQLLIINFIEGLENSYDVVKNNHNLYIPIIEGYIEEIESNISNILTTDVDVSIVNLRNIVTCNQSAVLVEEYSLDKRSGLLFPVLGRKEDYALLDLSANYGCKKSH